MQVYPEIFYLSFSGAPTSSSTHTQYSPHKSSHHEVLQVCLPSTCRIWKAELSVFLFFFLTLCPDNLWASSFSAVSLCTKHRPPCIPTQLHEDMASCQTFILLFPTGKLGVGPTQSTEPPDLGQSLSKSIPPHQWGEWNPTRMDGNTGRIWT